MSETKKQRVRAVIRHHERRDQFLVLLNLRANFGKVTLMLPGGGVEDGEGPMQALEREMWEELGVRFPLTAANCKLLFAKKYTFGQDNVELVFYALDHFDCIPRNMEEGKVATISWVTLAECERLVGVEFDRITGAYRKLPGAEENYVAQLSFFDAVRRAVLCKCGGSCETCSTPDPVREPTQQVVAELAKKLPFSKSDGKECPSDHVRDEATEQCLTCMGEAELSETDLWGDKVHNPAHQAEKNKTPVKCPPGQVRNNRTGQCEVIRGGYGRTSMREGVAGALAGEVIDTLRSAGTEFKGWTEGIEEKGEHVRRDAEELIAWLKGVDKSYPNLSLEMGEFKTWLKTSSVQWRFFYLLDDGTYAGILKAIQRGARTELEGLISLPLAARANASGKLESAKSVRELIGIVQKYQARAAEVFKQLRQRPVKGAPFQVMLLGLSDLELTVRRIVNLSK